MQLLLDALAVGFRCSCGEAFPQLNNFFFASAAPANLRPSAGCGHNRSLLMNGLKSRGLLLLTHHSRWAGIAQSWDPAGAG